MNVFVLDLNPTIAAQYHNDTHVRKMILESAQILSTALRINGAVSDILYKSTHINHPCTKICSTNSSNFLWVLDLMESLGAEYTYRFNKVHKSMGLLPEINRYSYLIPEGDLEFAQAMPDEYRNIDVVTAYRNYYRCEKKYMKDGRLMEVYTNRDMPYFLKENLI